MARSVREIEAELEAHGARGAALMGELRQARVAEAKERSAAFFNSLPTDWKERIIAAAEVALLVARDDEFSQSEAELGPAVSSFEIQVHIEPEEDVDG